MTHTKHTSIPIYPFFVIHPIWSEESLPAGVTHGVGHASPELAPFPVWHFNRALGSASRPLVSVLRRTVPTISSRYLVETCTAFNRNARRFPRKIKNFRAVVETWINLYCWYNTITLHHRATGYMTTSEIAMSFLLSKACNDTSSAETASAITVQNGTVTRGHQFNFKQHVSIINHSWMDGNIVNAFLLLCVIMSSEVRGGYYYNYDLFFRDGTQPEYGGT